MTLEPGEFLRRLSVGLKTEIGPNIDHEYTRTQAFMASVILERVSKQVEFGPRHHEAEAADMAELHTKLADVLVDAPDEIAQHRDGAARAASVAALGPLIEALYRWGSNQPEVSASLDLIRPALRADIDRRMEIAK